MLTRRRGDEDGDAGMSLIELMLAMGLGVIVMTIALNFFVGALQNTDAATTDSLNTAQARVALDSWSGLIRVADSPVAAGTTRGRFETISPTDAVFYADIANRQSSASRKAPTKIWLSMAGGQLIERRYPADNPNANPATTPYTYSTYPASPSTKRILAGCTTGTASTACATAGTVGSASGFMAYYSAIGCPAASMSSAGLCLIDPATTPTLDDAVAIGLSFTMTSANGRQTKGFTTLASATAGAS